MSISVDGLEALEHASARLVRSQPPASKVLRRTLPAFSCVLLDAKVSLAECIEGARSSHCAQCEVGAAHRAGRLPAKWPDGSAVARAELVAPALRVVPTPPSAPPVVRRDRKPENVMQSSPPDAPASVAAKVDPPPRRQARSRAARTQAAEDRRTGLRRARRRRRQARSADRNWAREVLAARRGGRW